MTRRVLAAAWCAVVTIGLLSPGSPARAATTRSVSLCAFVKPVGTQTANDAVRSFESQIGRNLDVHREYVDWRASFPGPIQRSDAAAGRIPFIDWGAPSSMWRSISSGQQDSNIRARARALKSFGHVVYVSIQHEPENDGGSAANFIAAWKHIHRIFDDVGAKNVRWVWTLMASTFYLHKATPWYPGPRWVDYVGVDGYSWFPGRRGSKWRSFEEIFTPAYHWSRRHSKPIVIGETGVQEDPNNSLRKKAWFIDALATLQSWPLVKTFCYFDSNQIYKWWIDTSTAALTGFRTIAGDPYMGG